MRSNACVVGSGPNGLAAAITLARAGIPTTVLEAADTVGGGTRSAELTLPGFIHDICSAVHPMAVSSPLFASLPLHDHGLHWIHPPIQVAHPFDNGSVAVLYRSLDETCASLGADGLSYRLTIRRFVEHWSDLAIDLLQPIQHFPHRPVLLARFGALAIRSAVAAAESRFRSPRTRALWAGLCAHSVLPLESPGSASFGLVLAASAHAVGWPIPRGGAQQIANAMAACFQALGGGIVTNTRIASLSEIPDSSLTLCDLTPRQFLAISTGRLPAPFRAELARYRYGPGAFKMDWALSSPIPWRAPECSQAATVHLGGTIEEIAACERAAWRGETVDRPFVILVQPSLFDPTRAPEERHTAWAYCHVPHGSGADMRERIEQQVERFAPGFRDCILARSVLDPAALERHNPNLVGGDVVGGAHTLRQLLFRPTSMLYRTPLEGVYLCSASTPPGGGVHGMCGFNAARLALHDAGIPQFPRPTAAASAATRS
ncbi:MAG TPA: NAD(P)/FAD-dependent oxidoreductase [Bryobacteraceae bacterium]|nr:NAD(P)/FAD-dependent oxidoreductase [Bryobacteraceae bacterium]